MDVEAGGGALTGALMAGAVERPGGRAGEPHHACSDCGATVEGRFCAQCGQPAHVHRTLLHLGEEILHGVMHFDGRLWRTLPLLFTSPGRLTREWIQGRRTRYVSPLAMFLFTMFVMFMALSFAPQPQVMTQSVAERIQMEQAALASAEAEVEKARAAAQAAEKAFETSANGGDRVAKGTAHGLASGTLAAAEARVVGHRESLAELMRARDRVRADALEPGSWQAQIADLDWGTDKAGFGYKLKKKLQNPDLALYKLQQTMYKFSFLLIPLSIPFMALLFLWRRGITLYDHGVTVLYSLTFMAMLGMAVVVASLVEGAGTWAVMAACLIAPVHMFAQIKGAYGLSVFSALWRTAVLLVFCAIIVGLFMTAIVYRGLGT